MSAWKPASYPSVSPYLICEDGDALIDFMQSAFGGSVQRRFNRPDGSLMHAEIRIDDSIVMVGGGATGVPHAAVHVHLYVEDAAAVFARAVAAGASVVREPTRADEDLRGGVQDRWGTTWWIATQQAS